MRIIKFNIKARKAIQKLFGFVRPIFLGFGIIAGVLLLLSGLALPYGETNENKQEEADTPRIKLVSRDLITKYAVDNDGFISQIKLANGNDLQVSKLTFVGDATKDGSYLIGNTIVLSDKSMPGEYWQKDTRPKDMKVSTKNVRLQNKWYLEKYKLSPYHHDGHFKQQYYTHQYGFRIVHYVPKVKWKSAENTQ